MEAFFRTRVGWWSVILLFALALESRAAEPRRRVLLLHSFNYSFPATSVIAEAARKRLVERWASVEIDAEFLDLARNTDPAHALRTATFIRDKYGQRPPDLVITLGSAALPFVVKYRDFIPDVPIVFTSISPQTYAALPMPPKMTTSVCAAPGGPTVRNGWPHSRGPALHIFPDDSRFRLVLNTFRAGP